MRILAALRDPVLAGCEAPLARVALATGAGTACGSCHPEILELVADWQGDPVPGPVRIRHRRYCRSETVRRIQDALRTGSCVALTRGEAAVGLEHLSGLDVTLSLEPDDPSLRAKICQLLRARVCRDLRVSFSKS